MIVTTDPPPNQTEFRHPHPSERPPTCIVCQNPIPDGGHYTRHTIQRAFLRPFLGNRIAVYSMPAVLITCPDCSPAYSAALDALAALNRLSEAAVKRRRAAVLQRSRA